MIQQPQGLFSLLIKVSFSRAQRCLLICAAHHSPPWCRLQGAGLSRVSPRPVLEQPDPESTNKNMRTLNIELGNSSIFFLNKFYWRLVDLQCCVSFCSIAKWVSHTHTCVCVCVGVWVTRSCPNLCDPMDCSLPGSSVHGVLQTRRMEWVSIPFTRESSWPRDQTLGGSFAWQADSLPSEPQGSPPHTYIHSFLGSFFVCFVFHLFLLVGG